MSEVARQVMGKCLWRGSECLALGGEDMWTLSAEGTFVCGAVYLLKYYVDVYKRQVLYLWIK